MLIVDHPELLSKYGFKPVKIKSNRRSYYKDIFKGKMDVALSVGQYLNGQDSDPRELTLYIGFYDDKLNESESVSLDALYDLIKDGVVRKV